MSLGANAFQLGTQHTAGLYLLPSLSLSLPLSLPPSFPCFKEYLSPLAALFRSGPGFQLPGADDWLHRHGQYLGQVRPATGAMEGGKEGRRGGKLLIDRLGGSHLIFSFLIFMLSSLPPRR